MNLENMKRQLLSAIEGEKIKEQLEIYEELERIEVLTSILDEEVDKKIERKQFIKKIKEDS